MCYAFTDDHLTYLIIKLLENCREWSLNWFKKNDVITQREKAIKDII